MKDKAIKKIAMRKAGQSTSKIRVSAIAISKAGNVLGSASNRPRFNRFGGGMHAEMALLQKVGPGMATMIICRIGRGGAILPIEPCKSCRKTLDKLGIRVVSIQPEADNETPADSPQDS